MEVIATPRVSLISFHRRMQSGPRRSVSGHFADARGVSRLAVTAVTEVTEIVENMHGNIVRLSPIVGRRQSKPLGGIPGLVYRSIHGVTRLVGFGLDTAFALGTRRDEKAPSSPRRDALLAVLNGVVGDHLAATDNPLAISMGFRKDGQPLTLNRQALAAAFFPAGRRIVVLMHGLCRDDLGWQREGHDHGAALARDLFYTPVYLHYNSGRHVSTNGREFSELMEGLVREWPEPVEELVIVGHSMGGLVARSACHYGRLAGREWVRHLKKMIFLGTPHHGSPLERAGHWTEILVGISPYTAPLTKLGALRSAGITDLRFGSVLDEDWMRRRGVQVHDPRRFVPLPSRVKCYAIAASKRPDPISKKKRPAGDGLVPVTSALGQHREEALALPIPKARKRVFYGLAHLDLLGSREVYDQIRAWLAEGEDPKAMPRMRRVRPRESFRA
jgi:pimeloyl-ACP methyl ester carboxylesterase